MEYNFEGVAVGGWAVIDEVSLPPEVEELSTIEMDGEELEQKLGEVLDRNPN